MCVGEEVKREVEVETLSPVERGIRWLDKEHPGWHKKIDLRILDLNQCRKCVLGQLFGDFNRFTPPGSRCPFNTSAFTNEEWDYYCEWIDCHGFDLSREFPRADCSVAEINAEYASLTEQWEQEIRMRQESRIEHEQKELQLT
jgi:hypothetical protein